MLDLPMTAAPFDQVQTVDDVALVFEGGGMRAAVSAPVVQLLLREGITFPLVCGISAGSSHCVNFLARQIDRAKRSFVEFGADPRIGNIGTWLRGRGLFDSEYVYMQTAGPNDCLPLDFASFKANPAELRIGAFSIDDGQEVYFRQNDITCLRDLMLIVRASSSMPILMPPTEIKGRKFLDGAMGAGGGIPLDIAIAEGYKRFFIVLTRDRSYRKTAEGPSWLFKTWWRNHPAVAEALVTRPPVYNTMREQIFDLEQSGQALVFAPATPPPSRSSTTDVAKLQATYDMGLAQAEAELPGWKEWLGL